jgi:hypothetical protein
VLWSNNQFFCRQVHAVTVNRRSSMRNWLFGLLMSKKIMSMLLTLLFICLTFSDLGEFGLSVYGYAFFPEFLFNHHHGLRCIFPDICTKSDAVPLSDPLRICMRPDTWLQIKECKQIRTSTQLYEISYTDFQDVLVLSSTIASHYYNCCTDGSTGPRNYAYHGVTSP